MLISVLFLLDLSKDFDNSITAWLKLYKVKKYEFVAIF